MDTQIADSYRAMMNAQGIPMVIVSDLESAFEPVTVYLTQTGLNIASDTQRIVIRNMDETMLSALKEKKRVFLALSDKERQEFNFEKSVHV